MSTQLRDVLAVTALAVGLSAVLIWIRRQRKTILLDAPCDVEKPISLPTNFVGRFRVFFGSQTGTSESFSNDLVAEAVSDFGIDCGSDGAVSVETLDPDVEFSLSAREKGVSIVFLLSTYGEGDPSDDAVQFDEWLFKRLELFRQTNTEECSLKGVSYAIFGLGNKQYAHFNAMAKRTDKRMQALGGIRLCGLGYGDDNADIEQDWEDWKLKQFWPSFTKKNNLSKSSCASLRDPMDKVLLDVRIAAKRSQLPFDATVTQGGSDVVSKFFFASNIVPVTSKTALCPGKVQLDLDITKVPSLRYRTGDTLDVLPVNRAEDIEWFLAKYKLEKTDMMTFIRKKNSKKLTVKKPFPTPCSIEAVVTRYIDLSGPPSRSLVRDVAILRGLNPEEEVEIFLKNSKKMASIRTFLEKKFPPVDFGTIIQLLPKMKSRAYSICSSALKEPKIISLLVSKVDDNALASSWLVDSATKNNLLHVTLRAGVFRLPPLKTQPVIMICVGTGFAPFRAFLAELKTGDTTAILFFGCRTEEDWIYREEMSKHRVFLATSREGKKQYVQDLVLEELSLVKSLLAAKGVIYVCGSTAMGLGVMQTLQTHAVDVESLRRDKQYIEELWG